LASYSTLSSEFRIIPAATPAAAPRVFQQRQQDHEYTIDHAGDYFYIRTNLEAENFRLMRTPVNNTGLAHWEELIPHRENVLLEEVDIFKNYLVVSEMENGLSQIRIRDWSTGEEHFLDF